MFGMYVKPLAKNAQQDSCSELISLGARCAEIVT